MTNSSFLTCVLTLSAWALPCPAQDGRPTARVDFSVPETVPKNNYHFTFSTQENRDAVARMIEEELFPATFLERAIAGEMPQYTLKVELKEQQLDALVQEPSPSSPRLKPVYLHFSLVGQFDNAWDPTGVEFRWLFRDAVKAAENLADFAPMLSELKLCIQELRKSQKCLTQGLLCYIPLVHSAESARYGYLFAESLPKPKLRMRLPLVSDQIGLKVGSQFLVRIQRHDKSRVFHLLKSRDESPFMPAEDLPEPLRGRQDVDGLTNGIVAADALKPEIRTGVVAMLASTGAPTAGREDSALNANQILRLVDDEDPDEWRLQPLAIVADAPESQLVEILGLYVGESESTVPSLHGPDRKAKTPTEVAKNSP